MEHLRDNTEANKTPTLLQLEKRRAMAAHFVDLGPSRFIETLRVIDTFYIGASYSDFTEIFDACTEKGLLETNMSGVQQFNSIFMGYINDQLDWHKTLNPVPEAKSEQKTN